jgi:hypothetical protein
MRQLSSLPVRIIQLDPANLSTGDAAFFGTGDNGLDYCIKTVDKTPAIPAAEYICHFVARCCGIAVPEVDVVVLPDGSEAFGSVWEGTALDRQQAVKVLTGNVAGKQIEQCLARIFALDLFVHNVDRHSGNYLCVVGRGSTPSLKAFDFSRAFTYHRWPLPDLPMDSNSNTMRLMRGLRQNRSVDLTEGYALLDKVGSLPFADFKTLVQNMPKTWMDGSLRKKVTEWWARGRAERVAVIRDGFKNGSIL